MSEQQTLTNKKIKTVLLCDDGTIQIPERYKNQKRLVITTPYAKEVRNGNSIMLFFRDSRKEKPYIPDGYVSFKMPNQEPEMFVVVDKNGVQQFWRRKDENPA